MKKVSIVSTCSGNGKTTLGKQLASILEVPFVELDALVHGPNWTETPDDELVRMLEPILAGDGWVIDGNYSAKFGNLVLEHADTVVWLDLPIRVWLPRLIRRTTRPHHPPRGALERQPGEPQGRDRREGRAHPLRLPDAPPEAPDLSRAARGIPDRAAPDPGGGRRVRQLRRRALNSATQAATRRPIQIGVRIT